MTMSGFQTGFLDVDFSAQATSDSRFRSPSLETNLPSLGACSISARPQRLVKHDTTRSQIILSVLRSPYWPSVYQPRRGQPPLMRGFS